VTIQAINQAIIDTLKAETDKQVGDGTVPVNPVFPYMIVYTLISGEPEGSLADESEMRDLIFQFTYVGVNNAQCLWMGDKAEAARPWLNKIPNVMRVIFDQIGSVTREDGNTYIRHDTVRVKWSSK